MAVAMGHAFHGFQIPIHNAMSTIRCGRVDLLDPANIRIIDSQR